MLSTTCLTEIGKVPNSSATNTLPAAATVNAIINLRGI